MNLSALIVQYGYLALFAGCLLEGETVLILAGLAAHQGYLQLHWVIIIALTGGFAGDQIYFWLGRRHGGWVLSCFPGLVPLFERANLLIARYHELLIFGVRFMYGFRTAGPVALGMSGVSAGRFLLFNALGAATWAVLVGGGSYLFGDALQLIITDIKKMEVTLFVVVLSLSFLLWGWRRYKFRKKLK